MTLGGEMIKPPFVLFPVNSKPYTLPAGAKPLNPNRTEIPKNSCDSERLYNVRLDQKTSPKDILLAIAKNWFSEYIGLNNNSSRFAPVDFAIKGWTGNAAPGYGHSIEALFFDPVSSTFFRSAVQYYHLGNTIITLIDDGKTGIQTYLHTRPADRRVSIQCFDLSSDNNAAFSYEGKPVELTDLMLTKKEIFTAMREVLIPNLAKNTQDNVITGAAITLFFPNKESSATKEIQLQA